MPDDLSAIAAPQYPSAVDLALSGGPATGPVMQSPDASSPEQLQPAQISNQAPPEGATAPLNMPSAAPYMGTPTPPDVKLHMDWIHRAVNATANALAGPTTWQVTKLPDGTVTSTQMPSTGKEKWGEIAAAALTGAAQGFTHSQGPGGLGNAAAAGLQTGLQIPQQQKEQSQETADFQNKQMMSTANRIHLTNQTYMLQQQLKEADLKYSQDVADTLNKETDMLIHSPNAVDLGKVDPSNHDEIMNLAKTNPAAYDAYLGKGNQILRYMPDPTDHKMHMVLTDKTWEQQKNSEAMDALSVGTDKDGVPTMIHTNVPANGGVVGDILNNNAAATTKLAAATKDYADAHAKLNPPVKPPPEPKTLPEIRVAESNATTPAEKARLHTLGEQVKKDDEDIKRAGKSGKGGGSNEWANPLQPSTLGPTPSAYPAPPGAVPPGDGGGGGGGGELGDEGNFVSQFTQRPSAQGQQILDKLPTAQANLVRRFGNYLADESKELPRGQDRLPFLNMVSAVYPNFNSGMYPARSKLINSLSGDGHIAQSRNAFNLAIQHMGEMYDDMKKVDPGEYPASNVTQKTWHLSGGFGDKAVKDAYGGYADSNLAVATEMARAFSGRAPNEGEIEQYQTHTDITSPRSMQEGSFRARSHMLASRLENLNTQLQDGFQTPGANYRLLTPASIQTLQRLPGGDEILKRAGVSTGPPPPQQNKPKSTLAPAGDYSNPKTIAYDGAGNYQWFNGKAWVPVAPPPGR